VEKAEWFILGISGVRISLIPRDDQKEASRNVAKAKSDTVLVACGNAKELPALFDLSFESNILGSCFKSVVSKG
jgi:hypothetical protein